MSVDAATTREKLDRLRSHLRRETTDGEYYFKSKHITEEVDLTPKEIGHLIVRLQEADTDLRIDRWAYTNATTWRVTREDR